MLYFQNTRRFRWFVEPQCYSGLCIYMHLSSQCAAVCISCLEATLRFCVPGWVIHFLFYFFGNFLLQCARIVWGEGGSRRVCDNEQVVLCIAYAKQLSVKNQEANFLFNRLCCHSVSQESWQTFQHHGQIFIIHQWWMDSVVRLFILNVWVWMLR